MKKFFALFLALIMVISLAACASAEDSMDDEHDEDSSDSKASGIVGEWYNEDGKCLDIRSDGTWKLEDSYGTGTWKELDDDIYEFTDFYGDTQESEINKDDKGEYIDFGYYGDFYKGRYPAENDDTDNENKDNSDHSTEPETNVIELDPFENLSFEVSGISPYCIIAVNNANCDSDVQKYVTYKFDKDSYANGEVANITAVLSARTGENEYSLTSTTMEYEISNQPEYITSLDGVDLTMLKTELADVIIAEQSSASGGRDLFTLSHVYAGGTHFESCDDVVACDTYFSTLKVIKYSMFDMIDMPFNQISFTYSVDYTWGNGNNGNSGSDTFWINLSAGNIILYPDGSIKWGYASSDAYDFKCSYSQVGLENCVSTTIMNNRDNYNISKVNP